MKRVIFKTVSFWDRLRFLFQNYLEVEVSGDCDGDCNDGFSCSVYFWVENRPRNFKKMVREEMDT